MKSKISIVIPVYNVELYLRKCLDSVLGQTHKNLEILLIDDGSPDKCGEICDEYAEKDDRIKVFHQENRGLSAALNVGLMNFTGDYLGFVDSDDWIEPEMFEHLLKAIESLNVPVSITNYYKDDNGHASAMANRVEIPHHQISVQNMLLYPLMRDDYMGFCAYVWNKLYSAEIIKASAAKFDEEIKFGLDILFNNTLFLKTNATGAYVDKPLYHYLQRNTGISTSRSYDIKLDILKSYKRVEALFNDHGYSEHSFWVRGFYCYHAGVLARIAIANHDDATFKQMQTDIAAHIDDYAKTNPDFPEKVKAMRDLLTIKGA